MSGSGEYLKRRPQPHWCDPPHPDAVGYGTVWRCTCGRRWKRTIDYRENRATGAVWRRRVLPWPRSRSTVTT